MILCSIKIITNEDIMEDVMGKIKQSIRNIRYGTKIRTALSIRESLLYQDVLRCSTNKGRLWCSAVIGLTDKRVLIEWQRIKGKNIVIPHQEIVTWKVTKEIGGLSEKITKFSTKKYISVDIAVNEETEIRLSGEYADLEIFINHMKKYCLDKLV